MVKLPLWKACLDRMRDDGLAFGSVYKADYFEENLRCKRTENQFQFEMLALRETLEKEDGYYMRSRDSGAVWEIVPAEQVEEEVAKTFDQKCRRYAVRSINIRAATLQNPTAQLSGEEKTRMEANLEKASVRLILMSRQKAVMAALDKSHPKLLGTAGASKV